MRVIAATNRDLEAALAEDRFREDLYYRLKVVTLRLPPLRERAGDISMLAVYFLRRFAREMSVDSPGITEEAKNIMEHYAWPGNVRELGNTIQKALIFSRGSPISGEEISLAIRGEYSSGEVHRGRKEDTTRQCARRELASSRGERMFTEIIDRFSGMLITEALNMTGGNRSQAAKLLGLSRPTLLAKIEKYGIKIETAVKND